MDDGAGEHGQVRAVHARCRFDQGVAGQLKAAAAMNAPSGPAPLLQVRDVTLQYRTEKHLVTATYRVSFDVYGSDRFVLLGPSGCGKSTLLKAVGGYMPPTEGHM